MEYGIQTEVLKKLQITCGVVAFDWATTVIIALAILLVATVILAVFLLQRKKTPSKQVAFDPETQRVIFERMIIRPSGASVFPAISG